MPDFTFGIKIGIIKNLAVRESIVAFHDHVLKNSSKIPVEFVRFQEEVEKDARAYSALVKLLDEMTFIYSERGGNTERGLDEFAQRFKTAVMGARYQVREKNGLGVMVTTIEETRGAPFKVMILCGAVDGEFPGRYVPESFLGKELPESEERFIEKERLQFYQFLTNNVKALDAGEKKLFITYPKHSTGGDELVRSPFIDALLKVTSLHYDECCYDGHELIQRHGKSNADFSPKETSAVEWLTSIGSDDEVLKLIGGAYQSAQRQKKQLLVLENIESIIDTYELDEPAQYVRSMVSRYGDTPVVTGQILLKELSGAAGNRLEGFKNHNFSISELETYAKCGYKFFSHRLLNLKEKAGEDSQTLSAIERGTLFHTVLFKFYRKLQDEQIKSGETKIIAKAKVAGMPPLAPVKLDIFKKEEYSALLKDIAREELSRISYEHVFFTMEQEELLGTEEKKGQLDIWLDGELNKLHSEKPWQFVPVLFETAFGMGDSVEPVKVGDISLRGKIDRIEILKDGDSWKFLIADYKSSATAVPTIGDLKSGQAFQVPLYLEAAKDFLEKCYGIEASPAGGAYYIFNPRFDKKSKKYDASKPFLVPQSLKDSIGARGHHTWLRDEGELFNAIESVGASAEAIAFKMTEGEYFAEPSHEKHCGQCSYASVCRIREVNVSDNETERTEEES